MSESYTRICFLLASAGFRERELVDFVLALRENDTERFVEDILSKRSLMLSDNRESHAEGQQRQKQFRSVEDTLTLKVTQLLVDEAKMTKFEASEALRMELMKKGAVAPPSLGKRSFADWLGLLSRTLPASEILHLATRIRNQYVHTGDTDWSLK